MQKIYKKSSNIKRGFSLIELSIVLVIIGILIVGISTGKSLIKSSKVSAARSATLTSQIVNIPGMIAWFESSTKDSFKRSESVDGAQIGTWYNIAPSSFLFKNNLTTTASNNVKYKEDAINDIPAVAFSGGSLSLANFANSPLSESTIVIVFRPTSVMSTAQGIFDSGSGNLNSLIGFRDDTLFLNAGIAANISNNFNGNSPYILAVNFNGNSSRYFINSVTGGAFNAGSNALNGITIGAYDNGGSPFSGEISEVIIYDRSLSNNQIKDVVEYLSKKFKIKAGL